MKKIENIMNMLDQVVFHDIPVKGFYVENDENFLVRIDYYLYVESQKDYDAYSLVFSDIETLKFQDFLLTKRNDLEISSFDYRLDNDLIRCRIIFLTGFAEASIELEIDCRNIEIIKNEHKCFKQLE